MYIPGGGSADRVRGIAVTSATAILLRDFDAAVADVVERRVVDGAADVGHRLALLARVVGQGWLASVGIRIRLTLVHSLLL